MDLGHPHSSHHHYVAFGNLGCVVQEVGEDMCRLPDGSFKVYFVDKMGWICYNVIGAPSELKIHP